MSFTFVHGRAQEQFTPGDLKTKWLSALRLGAQKSGIVTTKISDADVYFPYYARTLAGFVDAKSDKEEVTRSSDFVAEFKSEAIAKMDAGGVNRDKVVANSREDEVRSLPSDELRREVFNNLWVIAASRFLDRNTLSFSQRAIDQILNDVGVYLTDKKASDAVNQIVSSQIIAMDRPRTILAHSLGSVVAYRVLRELPNDFVIDHLVTVGCPLGVRAVSSRLAIEGSQTPIWPPNVLRWTNAADERDIVALNPRLDRKTLFSDAYISSPLQYAELCNMTNLSDVSNHTDNHHSIEGYLDDPLVAKAVLALS